MSNGPGRAGSKVNGLRPGPARHGQQHGPPGMARAMGRAGLRVPGTSSLFGLPGTWAEPYGPPGPPGPLKMTIFLKIIHLTPPTAIKQSYKCILCHFQFYEDYKYSNP